MERRGFVKLSMVGLAALAVPLLAACGKTTAKAPKLANQEKYWLASLADQAKEPIDLAYAKNTPALYRDASFGKEDPNFKPKTGGG